MYKYPGNKFHGEETPRASTQKEYKRNLTNNPRITTYPMVRKKPIYVTLIEESETQNVKTTKINAESYLSYKIKLRQHK